MEEDIVDPETLTKEELVALVNDLRAQIRDDDEAFSEYKIKAAKKISGMETEIHFLRESTSTLLSTVDDATIVAQTRMIEIIATGNQGN